MKTTTPLYVKAWRAGRVKELILGESALMREPKCKLRKS